MGHERGRWTGEAGPAHHLTARPVRYARRASARRVAQPRRSNRPMSQALGSTVAGQAPVTGQRRRSWCALWCDSPNEGSASQATLRDSSPLSKGCEPQRWQSELISEVTCCSTRIRTLPAQTAAQIRPPPCRPAPSQQERQHEPGHHDRREGPRDRLQIGVPADVRRVPLRRRRRRGEQPADVAVQHPAPARRGAAAPVPGPPGPRASAGRPVGRSVGGAGGGWRPRTRPTPAAPRSRPRRARSSTVASATKPRWVNRRW